jgi:metallo-beta-lactamase class B
VKIGALAVLAAACAATPAPPPLAPLAPPEIIAAAERAPVEGFAAENGWNEPFEPFRVIGNIYYVGTKTVSSWLITTPQGHILLDGVVPQSAPQIIANVGRLGFDIKQVKYLLNSHAHIDHAGGLAGLQLASGATMVASAADKPYLEAGDIGFGPTAGVKFPPVRVDRVVGDGDTVALGGVVLTAHMTPGHSPGCTSWSMRVTGADAIERTAFFHGSSTVAGQSLVPEAYPGMVADFRRTFAKVRELRADVFLANHDSFFDLAAKRARQLAGDANAFVDAGELGRFNELMERAFEEELAKQSQ